MRLSRRQILKLRNSITEKGKEERNTCRTAPCRTLLSEFLQRRVKTTNIEDDYVLGNKIAEGGYGSVRLCKKKLNGRSYALKTVPKFDEHVPPEDELQIMLYLSGHPGLVSLKDVYEDSQSFHVVMELCSGGDLYSKVTKEGPLKEAEAAVILKQLMLVVKYLHEKDVVHRDVKPSNILLTRSGHVKLADFGFSAMIADGDSLSDYVGTPAYVAPEVLTGYHEKKVDIWSMGVVLHFLLVGRVPYNVDSIEYVSRTIRETPLSFDSSEWDSVSRSACDLIRRILTVQAYQRPTIDELLTDPWIVHHTKNT